MRVKYYRVNYYHYCDVLLWRAPGEITRNNYNKLYCCCRPICTWRGAAERAGRRRRQTIRRSQNDNGLDVTWLGSHTAVIVHRTYRFEHRGRKRFRTVSPFGAYTTTMGVRNRVPPPTVFCAIYPFPVLKWPTRPRKTVPSENYRLYTQCHS